MPSRNGCEPRIQRNKGYEDMGCLCNLFENDTIWLIILCLLVLSLGCGSNSFGCGGNR